MNNKILYSIIAVAFVGGMFTVAYAGPLLPKITLAGDVEITGDMTCNNCVDSGDLGFGAVGPLNINNDAVQGAHILANAVDSSEIADDAVGSDEIADDAVTGSKIAGTSKFEFGSCSTTFTSITAGNARTLNCPHAGALTTDEVVAIQGNEDTSCMPLTYADIVVDGQVKFTSRNICSLTLTSVDVDYNYIIFNIP